MIFNGVKQFNIDCKKSPATTEPKVTAWLWSIGIKVKGVIITLKKMHIIYYYDNNIGTHYYTI